MEKRTRKIIKKKCKDFTETERHSIIPEMLKNYWTKQYAWELYTEEPGQLLRWMRILEYDTCVKTRRPNFTGNIPLIAKKKKTTKNQTLEEFETIQLKKNSIT